MSAPDDDDKPKPDESGSVDVALGSSTALPAQTDGTPTPVGDLESAPVSSGKVRVAVAGEQTRRTKRVTEAAKDAVGATVEKLGATVGTIGEGVSKLGEVSRKVPIVGAGVQRLGEGITTVGESLHQLPRAAKTRKGRLLVRSLFVGFVLVASWITVIVALQLHGNETPDFRPVAEKLLLELSKGQSAVEAVYDAGSPRFQEMVRKERFVDEMNDLAATVGKFREITAVNDSLVTSGPTGRIGRVSLTVAYDKATCKASVSLHEDDGVWKLLGIGVELPRELKITQAQREERVQACKDPKDKSCDLYVAADGILQDLRDGKADKVWDAASAVFQKQEERGRFIALQKQYQESLGAYSRILSVTEAKVIGGTNALYDVITEYGSSSGVAVTFGFYRGSRARPWKLRSLKIVIPMPRAGEGGGSPVVPAKAAGHGSGSAGASSAGAGSGPGTGAGTEGGSGSGAGTGSGAGRGRGTGSASGVR
ncbi:MAG: hypothetical protein JNL83_06115 [Myxococcales bacterium]|nr:hypothetical protein [Myxococcales bacterium]